jgi:hypothetical protein
MPETNITVSAGDLTIVTNGEIASGTFGSGNAGNVAVHVAGTLTIDGTSATQLTGVASNTPVRRATGSAGSVTVTAGSLNSSPMVKSRAAHSAPEMPAAYLSMSSAP